MIYFINFKVNLADTLPSGFAIFNHSLGLKFMKE